MLLSKQVS